MDDHEETVMQIEINEPMVRTLLYCIEFTLEKWPGDPANPMIQTALMELRTQFKGMSLEYDFEREYKG